MKIGDRLAIYGWKEDTDEFFDLAVKIFRSTGFPNVEQFLFNPIKALNFCYEVRSCSGVVISDEELLQMLMNLRKRGYF